MTGASRLTIEHSLFANLPATAVFVSGAGTLRIVHSIFRDNGGYAMDLQEWWLGAHLRHADARQRERRRARLREHRDDLQGDA